MENYGESFDFLKPLHAKHREIFAYIRDFCREINIDFCLAYGSALGARRHGGPIPWDDDGDIYMRAGDYARFRSAFLERGDREKFYLQENINVQGMIEFAKLRLNNSTFIQPELKGLDMHQGIYIDIFLLHPAPKKPLRLLEGRLAGYYVEFKRMALQQHRGKKPTQLLMGLLRSMPTAFGLKKALSLMYRDDCESSEKLVSWGYPFRIYSENMIFPTADLNYDGLMLPVPGDTDAYLSYVYGDWEKIPDMERAKYTAHSSLWETERDFRLYAPNIRNFSDEIHIL